VHIHIIGINYWPETTGIAVFSTGRAEYLASRGHRVTMCAAVPYYPEWRVAREYRYRSFARERRAGVEIRRCPVYVPSRVTPVRRVLHEASFIAVAFARSLFGLRPDLLFVVSPPLGLAAAAVVLSRLWRVPYVFHVADLQPDAALDLGMVKAGRAARLLYAVERMAYRNAALVSTLTEAMRARIVAKGIDGQKVTIFSDWADPELFALQPSIDAAKLRRDLGVGEAFIVLHAGNMGVKQGLDVVVDAAERTRDIPAVKYVLVGDGAMRRHLEARTRRAELSNVLIAPLLSRDRFMALLATADVCLVTQQRTVADIVFPSKVLTLLAAGRPVIASVNADSEVARVITGSGSGEVVSPEDPGALVAAVERLRGQRETRERMGAAGRAYARRHWERERTLAHLATTLESIPRSRSSAHAAGIAPSRSAAGSEPE
jgi:colanic acid biosynthesis glycosyl transferase WcaI